MITETDLLEQIKSTASGGLCQLSHEGTRRVLQSIRELCDVRLESFSLTGADSEAGDVHAVSPEVSAQVDAKLGLVELPPIRVTRELYGQIVAGAHVEGWIVQAYVRDLLAAAINGAAALIAVRSALIAYHHALDTRLHCGVAQGVLTRAIEEALGTPWLPGSTLSPATNEKAAS